MRRLFRNAIIVGIGGILGTLFFGPKLLAGSCWDCRKPRLDMPISLALGTVRTPEFLVKHEGYAIIIEAQKHLPLATLDCMMGLTTGPLDPNNCDKEPLLQADWKVWDSGQVVAEGSHFHDREGGAWANDSVDKYLGFFAGKSKKRYILEVKFTKDGSALNVTNPHLIVIMTKPTDF